MAKEKLAESDPILEEKVRRLVATFDPDQIYLYGSRARGEAGPNSDYDLMLVVSASPVPRYRRDQQAFRALCGVGVPKEVVVLTRAEFEAGHKVAVHSRLRCFGREDSFMQPDKLAEVRSWLKKAVSDLRSSPLENQS